MEEVEKKFFNFILIWLIFYHRKCFNGYVYLYKHESKVLNCEMKFRVYLPESTTKLPVLYFLSGLTCNYDNFITKSGVIQFASKHKIALGFFFFFFLTI